MKVQILGSGCDKCRKLTANVQEASVKLGLNCEIEKVTEIDRITEFGVMMTPALVVDGKVVSAGKVLSPDEVVTFLNPQKTCTCKDSADDSSLDKKACNCSDEPPNGLCGCNSKATNTGADDGSKIVKKVLTILLLLFVASSVAYTIFREINRGGLNGKASALQVKSDALIVYYFHRTQRCPTCNIIENLTQTAVTNKYAKELTQGSVVFKSVNIDLPENAHVIKDFELASGTVVLQKNGRYAKLDQVWPLAHQPERFILYVQSEVSKMMGENK